MTDMIAGMQLIESPFLTEYRLLRMCRSKRKRIKAKWLKNWKNYKDLPDLKNFYQMGNKIICHPLLARKLRHAIEKEDG